MPVWSRRSPGGWWRRREPWTAWLQFFCKKKENQDLLHWCIVSYNNVKILTNYVKILKYIWGQRSHLEFPSTTAERTKSLSYSCCLLQMYNFPDNLVHTDVYQSRDRNMNHQFHFTIYRGSHIRCKTSCTMFSNFLLNSYCTIQKNVKVVGKCLTKEQTLQKGENRTWIKSI